MTKIKNTKKGMAKKTLSISLAVAMLATSNVPVWAAEFTDGTDAAFTSEAVVETPVEEAPVVEEAVEAPGAEVAANYTLDTNMELASGTWNENVKLVKKEGVTDAAKFEITKNGVPVVLNDISYEVYYNDDIQGDRGKVVQVSDSMQLMSSAPGVNAYKQGGNVTVKFYVGDDKEAAATLSTQLKAVSLSTATITNGSYNVNYNGKSQRPLEEQLGVKVGTMNVPADAYVVKFKEDEEAKNYKETSYEFAVEGRVEEGYTGTSAYTGTFTINRAPSINADGTKNLSVAISGEATYNGANTKPTVVVTDLLANTVINEKLYDFSFDMDDTTSGNQVKVGTVDASNVVITMKDKATIDGKEVLNNFATNVDEECITGSFKVNALDLKKLGDKYTVQVNAQETETGAVTLTWNEITLIDKATGTIVEDKDAVLPINELTPVLTNNATPGKGRLTIKAANITNQNIINEFVADVVVTKNVITEKDVALPAGTKIGENKLTARTGLTESVTFGSTTKTLEGWIQAELDKAAYTGVDVEPLKNVFESFVWVNPAPNGEDLKFDLGKDYTVAYANNKDSEYVSGKDASVKFTFQGDYAGTFGFTFEIQRADVAVTGEDITYVAGQNSYDANVKVVTGAGTKNEKAVPASEYVVKTTKKAREIGDTALADVVFNNPNYQIVDADSDGDTPGTVTTDKCDYVKNVSSTLIGKSLESKDITAAVVGTYTFTGKPIVPTVTVKDGSTTLKLGVDYKVIAKHGIEAGDAYVTIEGIGNYSGKLVLKYTIEKADLATAIVESSKTDKKDYSASYDGTAQTPDIAVVKIGDVTLAQFDVATKTGDYELTYNLDAVEVGTYEFTLTALPTSKKVQGTYKGTFKVNPRELTGKFVKKTDGITEYSHLTAAQSGASYTGKAFTLDDLKTKLVLLAKHKDGGNYKELKDTQYRLEYKDNVDAGVATVKAFGLGNYAAKDKDGKELPIATLKFEIAQKDTIQSSWIRKINDVEYAGGLPVEPEVVVADNDNNRLVQGVDYTVVTDVIEIGEHTYNEITIKGKGAYVAGNIENGGVSSTSNLKWEVTKKDMKNTTVTVDKNDNVIVMNGTVVVPSTEYTVAFSADGSKVTVTAKEDSEHYTGSKEQDVDVAKVGKAMIKEVKVVGNKATVILSDKVENAEGYDFVIATEADYKNGRVDITKNQLKTSGDFTYVQKGVYYAYCHAWKRDENNQKVFGDWSNLFQFTVSATTPETPVITSVKRSGKNVTVTYKNAKNAEGYDVVLGSKRTKVNGELRPVEYGKLVQKNKTTTTVTFKNVPNGRYYVGMHAYNRSSVDNKKVFSRWANWSSSVTVK